MVFFTDSTNLYSNFTFVFVSSNLMMMVPRKVNYIYKMFNVT